MYVFLKKKQPRILVNQRWSTRLKKNKKIKNEKTIRGQIIKDVRNLFRLKKENEGIKDRIIRDIKNQRYPKILPENFQKY